MACLCHHRISLGTGILGVGYDERFWAGREVFSLAWDSLLVPAMIDTHTGLKQPLLWEQVMSGTKACRVLFVEDEAMVSMLIEDMLLDLGIEVVGPASKIEDARSLAHTADIEAAVLDINIGGHLTYDVADILRARSIPLIFSTGYGSSALTERFRGTPILHKPFDRHSFEKVVGAALADSPCEINSA